MDKRIYETDSYIEIAEKIFNNFEIGTSCCVRGTLVNGEEVVSKGEYVLLHLRHLDSTQNISTPRGDKRPRRKRVMLPDSIGGYVAQKIFKFKIDDNGLKVTVWRIQ